MAYEWVGPNARKKRCKESPLHPTHQPGDSRRLPLLEGQSTTGNMDEGTP